MSSALKSLKANTCLAFLIFAFAGNAQTIDSIAVGFKIDQYTLDPFNGIYLSDFSGNVYNYSLSGEKKSVFSARIREKVSELAIPVSGKAFAFYKSQQLCIFFDRFLDEESRVEIKEITNDPVELATLAPNNILWLITSFGELIKYDLVIRRTLAKTQTNLNNYNLSESLKLEADRQFVYVLVGNFLLCFDQFGNSVFDLEADYYTDLKLSREGIITHKNDSIFHLGYINKGLNYPNGFPSNTKKVLTHQGKHFKFYSNYFLIERN